MSTTDVAQLTYTDMVIKEVIRLFPIAPFLIRQCIQEVQIDGKEISYNQKFI